MMGTFASFWKPQRCTFPRALLSEDEKKEIGMARAFAYLKKGPNSVKERLHLRD